MHKVICCEQHLCGRGQDYGQDYQDYQGCQRLYVCAAQSHKNASLSKRDTDYSRDNSQTPI